MDKRNRTFDFLRGLAILGVICVHVSQAFPAQSGMPNDILGLGRFGVQIFFFVSALTMCYMWERRQDETRPVAKFYFRRFFRIAPLFWLAMLLYLPENYNILNNIDELRVVIASALFLHGLWPDSINAIVPGGWTIAVEMTFYGLFPWLVMRIRNRMVFLYLAIVVYFANLLLNLLLLFWFADQAGMQQEMLKNFLYMNFLNQAPAFLLGCYLYGEIHALAPVQYGKTAVIFLGWAAAALAANYYLPPLAQNVKFLLVVMGLYWLVRLAVQRGVTTAWLEKLGRNSYAIYLSHFAVISAVVSLYAQLGWSRNGWEGFLVALALVTMTAYLLSVAVYHLLEKRIQLFVNRVTG